MVRTQKMSNVGHMQLIQALRDSDGRPEIQKRNEKNHPRVALRATIVHTSMKKHEAGPGGKKRKVGKYIQTAFM